MIEYTYDIVVFLPMNNVEYLHDDLDSVREKKIGTRKKNSNYDAAHFFFAQKEFVSEEYRSNTNYTKD